MALRPIYSIQICSLFPALTSQTFTVPTGVKWIVRDMDVAAAPGTSPSQLVVHNAAFGVLWNVVLTVPAQGVSAEWRGRQVYNEGEFLVVEVISGTWSVQISGYELTNV